MKDSPSIPGTQQDRSGESRGRLLDAFLLGLAALVLRLPAYFAERGLTFDDGVFSLSAIAMRNGGVPFRDVFSSQGPLFLPLVWLGDLLGGRNLDSTRVLAVASGVTAVVVTYVVARRCSDRLGGILAGALVATSGAFMWVTGPLAADGPALAFAITTVWLSLRMRDRPGTLRAVLLGLATGAVLCTKSLEAPVLVVVGLVLAAPVASAARRGRVAWSAL
ncbi:MAG: glycosyltransferase family 39 protein, partial [Microthrixaceae bacterium]|nr:glycosyltransferase family 39 protein [Microthrixaceae bacterium]